MRQRRGCGYWLGLAGLPGAPADRRQDEILAGLVDGQQAQAAWPILPMIA